MEFITSPRTEPYGRVAVFRDISYNKWDLLGRRGREKAEALVSIYLALELRLTLPRKGAKHMVMLTTPTRAMAARAWPS